MRLNGYCMEDDCRLWKEAVLTCMRWGKWKIGNDGRIPVLHVVRSKAVRSWMEL